MKYIPALFNGEMVRAVLEGRKTQTRRVMKVPRGYEIHDPSRLGEITSVHPKRGKFGIFITSTDPIFKGVDLIPCPYGKPGDRLWVRETHYRFGHWEPVPGIKTKTGRTKWAFVEDSSEILFQAPESYRKGRHHKDPFTPAWHRRLPMFMPRRASRITLEVTDVRVERVQDICEVECIAEGVDDRSVIEGIDPDFYCEAIIEAFAKLWNSINEMRGYGWDANPWVWVVEFKRIQEAA